MPAAALEAPDPGAARSTTTTRSFDAASSRASAEPMTPAPMMTTSVDCWDMAPGAGREKSAPRLRKGASPAL
jgi:hypothetical protein